MNNQQYDRPHESDGVPAITVRVWVRPRQVERIVKHQHRGFERQAMLGAIALALSRSHVQRIATPRM